MLLAEVGQWRNSCGAVAALPKGGSRRLSVATRARRPQQRRSISNPEGRKDSVWEWTMDDEIATSSDSSSSSGIDNSSSSIDSRNNSSSSIDSIESRSNSSIDRRSNSSIDRRSNSSIDSRSWSRSSTSDNMSEKKLLDFFATCAPGVEFVVAAELSSASIGALNVRPGSAGVSFQGTSSEVAFRASLWLRCAVRVLHQIAAGELDTSSPDPVYDFIESAVVWSDFLGSSARHLRTFSVQSRVWDCPDLVTNANTASIRAKDAICDSLRRSCKGSRPQPPDDPSTADVPLFLSLYRGRAVLYRDLSGASLHMRGYKDAMHKASLNESIAAAMLTISGWNPWVTSAIEASAATDEDDLNFGSRNKGSRQDGRVLLDPMCGSGTILIEAALMAMNRAPGLLRSHWPFMNWHDFEKAAWEKCLSQAASAEISAPEDLLLLANDCHEGAIALCLRDAEKAGVRQFMEISCKDCINYVPPSIPSMVMVNPPWGNRLEPRADARLASTYLNLGKLLKCHCPDTDVYLLSGNSTLTRQIQMKADRKWPVTVGGLDCRLLHYHVLQPKAVDKEDGSGYKEKSEWTTRAAAFSKA